MHMFYYKSLQNPSQILFFCYNKNIQRMECVFMALTESQLQIL